MMASDTDFLKRKHQIECKQACLSSPDDSGAQADMSVIEIMCPEMRRKEALLGTSATRVRNGAPQGSSTGPYSHYRN